MYVEIIFNLSLSIILYSSSKFFNYLIFYGSEFLNYLIFHGPNKLSFF